MKRNDVNAPIAVIGLSVKVPGANNKDDFWKNLINNIESIKIFSNSELEQEPGFDSSLLYNSNYIKAKGILSDSDLFAASFFGFSKNKARIMDPQFRVIIESAWEAFEDAGLDIETYTGKIGIYTSSNSRNTYYENNLSKNPDILKEHLKYELQICNICDFLATTLAYQFNINGPCINVQTACSSSLVAICMACEELRQNKCDIAIACGVSIMFPRKNGYLYQDGMIYSNDGHCKPFSEFSSGIVPGEGAGVILLKRLSDAESDKDNIYGLIKGFSINNDGNKKLSYTAPSISGQLDVLKMASKNAGISSDTISYIEAHGTGTKLGDEIEISALKEYLSNKLPRISPCYIGSVKSNIGHLDVACGIIGFIKTLLSIKNKVIPKTLHCSNPIKSINGYENIIQIASDNIQWENSHEHPRRAGVSSFGVGGTNAHVIIEEYEKRTVSCSDDIPQIIPLSAKNKKDLENYKDNLSNYLMNSDASLGDISLTLQQGRKHFHEREAFVCTSTKELADVLYTSSTNHVSLNIENNSYESIIFLFDRCHDMNTSSFSKEIKNDYLIYEIWNKYNLLLMQDFSFTIEDLLDNNLHFSMPHAKASHALLTFLEQVIIAAYWIKLGIIPSAVFGIGVGEYTAAHVSGLLSFNDAINLLMAEHKHRNSNAIKTYIVIHNEEENNIFHKDEIEILAKETRNKFIISVKEDKARSIIEEFYKNKIVIKEFFYDIIKLEKSSFDEYCDLLDTIRLLDPKINFITSSGENSNKIYWENRLLYTNNIYDGCKKLLEKNSIINVDASLDGNLSNILQQVSHQTNSVSVKSISPAQLPDVSITTKLKMMIASAWTLGININWRTYNIHYNSKSSKTSLPGYVLEREKYFIYPISIKEPAYDGANSRNHATDRSLLTALYLPSWKQRPIIYMSDIFTNDILIVGNDQTSTALKEYLYSNDEFKKITTYENNNTKSNSMLSDFFEEKLSYWVKILKMHLSHEHMTIVYCSCLDNNKDYYHDIYYYYDLVALGNAIGKIINQNKIKIIILTNQTISVDSLDVINPIKASLLGPALCFHSEYPNVKVSLIDLPHNTSIYDYFSCVAKELHTKDNYPVIAYRNKKRYARYFINYTPKIKPFSSRITFKKFGTYLVTGGLGGIGLIIANHLAELYNANIILVSRSINKNWVNEAAANNNLSSEDMIKKELLNKIKINAKSLVIKSINISDYNKVLQMIIDVESSISKIDGIFHCAAIYPKGLMQQKNILNHKEMFEAKIDGLLVLDEIFKNKSLDFMILFSSLSSIRGGIGVVDYVAANNVLNAYSEYFNAKKSFPIVSICWDAWKEIGMRTDYYKSRLSSESKKYQYPLNFNYNLYNDLWKNFIAEHQYNNKWLIPATLIIELLSSFELSIIKEKLPLVFEKISFQNPGFIDNIDSSTIEVKYDKDKYVMILKDSNKTLTIANAFSSQNVKEMPILEHFHINTKDLDLTNNSLKNNRFKRSVSTGPHWKCDVLLKALSDEYVAQITLPKEFHNEIDNYLLHPSLLDIALNLHSYHYEEQYVPFLIEKITILSQLPISCISHVKVTSFNKNDGILRSDIIITDLFGKIILTVDNFVLKRPNYE